MYQRSAPNYIKFLPQIFLVTQKLVQKNKRVDFEAKLMIFISLSSLNRA